jgi:hypothetical protein
MARATDETACGCWSSKRRWRRKKLVRDDGWLATLHIRVRYERRGRDVPSERRRFLLRPKSTSVSSSSRIDGSSSTVNASRGQRRV